MRGAEKAEGADKAGVAKVAVRQKIKSSNKSGIKLSNLFCLIVASER
jgi:hypothetical protein